MSVKKIFCLMSDGSNGLFKVCMRNNTPQTFVTIINITEYYLQDSLLDDPIILSL